jgi:iron complex outermembrane receptor protein
LSISLKNIIITLLGIFIAITTNAQSITGVLQNEKGNPIDGASISILNTSFQTISNQKGYFSFNALKNGNYTLSIKSLGYADVSKEININATNNSKSTDIKFTLIASTNQLDEVVVTAEKKEELIQKIPASISSINAKQVNAFNLWNTKEITAIIPNVYSADPGDNRDVTSVRGIATSSYDPTVTTYIDGVNQFSLDTYIPSLFDIERIEVLRGPQGTLYGRNAMGGAINIITKQPTNTSTGFADIVIGNYNKKRISAGFKTPLIKDKLFFGASLLSDKRDGFYTNKFTKSPYDNQNGFSGNYFLKYIISNRWDINLNFKHHGNKNQGPFPLVFGTAKALASPYILNQNATTTMMDKTTNTSLSIHYAGTGFNFSSQTAYQQNYRYYTTPIDGDFSPIDAISIINNYGNNWNNIKVITQDFKFTSNNADNSKFKWTAGAFLFYQDAPVKQATRFGKDANLMMIGDSLFTIFSTSTTLKKGVAFYGQATYAINNQLNITLGLRNDYENQSASVMGQYQHDPSNKLYTTTADTLGRTHFNALSPKLSLDYQVNNNSLWYGNYSRGFRAGGLSPLSSDPSQPPLLGYLPEYSSNFETGIKNNWLNNKLIVNIALFYTKITDAQVPSLVLPDAITITKNTGQLTSKGIEAEIFAIPAKGLLLQYSFGTTNALYDKLDIASQGSTVNLAGKRPIFSPNATSLLAAQYSFPLNSRLKIMTRAEWKYIGTTYFDLANTIEQTPYHLLNAKTGIETEKIAFYFWAKNLAGTKYISYGYDFGAVHLGDPAIWGSSLSFKF